MYVTRDNDTDDDVTSGDSCDVCNSITTDGAGDTSGTTTSSSKEYNNTCTIDSGAKQYNTILYIHRSSIGLASCTSYLEWVW